MINLIPPQGHKAVKREYILRVGTTLSFLLGGVCILLTVALIPTFVLVRAQMHSSSSSTEQGNKDADALLAAENEVRITESVLAQLKSVPESTPATGIITELQKLAPVGIQFSNFSMEKTNGVYGRVQVNGTASTREVLSNFRRAIEASTVFASAELPISDLARDVNLPFALTLVIEPLQP